MQTIHWCKAYQKGFQLNKKYLQNVAAQGTSSTNKMAEIRIFLAKYGHCVSLSDPIATNFTIFRNLRAS